MDQYVLGIALDPFGRVALIRKNHPSWMSGKWNGIGGRLVENEAPITAMRRKFRENTGVDIGESMWRVLGTMGDGSTWRVYVFTVSDVSVQHVTTMTKETVALWTTWKLPMPCVDNLPGLVSMAQLDGERRPLVNLLYGSERK